MTRVIDEVKDKLAYQLVVEEGLSTRQAAQRLSKLGIKVSKSTISNAVNRVKDNPEFYKIKV